MSERRRKPRKPAGQASREVSLLARLRPWWPRLAKTSLGLGMVLLLAALVRWSQDPDTLPIQQVQIQGEFRYLSREEVMQALEGRVRGGFFNVDVAAIQSAVKTMGWVDEVSVRRVWPNTVRVAVFEQVPVARWGDDALLNTRGEVFAREGHALQDKLPALQGPVGREQALLQEYQQLAGVLSASQLEIVRLVQDERRALEMTLNNGVEVQLGRKEPLARMRRFLRAYPSLVTSRDETLQRVDLRYSNGFAARWIGDEEARES